MSAPPGGYVDSKSWDGDGDSLTVYIYGGPGISTSEIETAFDAITDAVDQIHNDDDQAGNVENAYVQAWNVTENEADLPCDMEEDRIPRAKKIRDAVYNYIETYAVDSRGCHLWITECEVARGWDNAWAETTVALVNTAWYGNPDEELGAMAIHEMLHTYVNFGCDDVEGRTEGDSEHELGSVNYKNEVTPLAASYVGDEDYHEDGECSGSNVDKNEFTYTLSDCTVKSVSDSLEHENAWFHDVL